MQTQSQTYERLGCVVTIGLLLYMAPCRLRRQEFQRKRGYLLQRRMCVTFHTQPTSWKARSTTTHIGERLIMPDATMSYSWSAFGATSESLDISLITTPSASAEHPSAAWAQSDTAAHPPNRRRRLRPRRHPPSAHPPADSGRAAVTAGNPAAARTGGG